MLPESLGLPLTTVAETINKINTVTMFALGIVALCAYVIFRTRRIYLLFLGVSFFGMGVTMLCSFPTYLVPLAIALLAFGKAIGESVDELKERLARMKVEEQRRETAFAEYLVTMARNEPPAEGGGEHEKAR